MRTVKMQSTNYRKHPPGPISWMAQNKVVANLLTIFLLLGGFISLTMIKQEVLPELELDIVQVSVEYPSSGPQEIEQAILLSIEREALSVEGVKRVSSTAIDGYGVVNIELFSGVDKNKSLQDIKNQIDSIRSFPEDAERPIVTLLEPARRVLSLIVFGNLNRRNLRDFSEYVREELTQLSSVTHVELSAVPDYEIAVEVPLDELRNYGLTLDEIAEVIADTAVEVPGGGIKTAAGEILLRTKERRDYAREFFDIPIISNPIGTNVYLGEIATLIDSFEESDREAHFNGQNAVKIDVYRVGDQAPLQIAEEVKSYVEKTKAYLPYGVLLQIWNDQSKVYEARIGLLVKNAQLGLLFIIIILVLFIEPRVAFWVSLGVGVSIIGSFLIIPLTGATINMVSLFAFIVTLGIIVDDAIVVGENIYEKREKGVPPLQAAIDGTREISVPVVFAVLTNIVAFIPFLFIPGPMGTIFFQIPAIVISVFAISLIEVLLILPAHLSVDQRDSTLFKILKYPSRFCTLWIKKFQENQFRKQVQIVVKYRYITMSIFISLFVIFSGILAWGYIPFSYFPRVDSDIVTAQIVLPFGVPIEESRAVEEKLIASANQVIQNNGDGISNGIYTQIGTVLESSGPVLSTVPITNGSHLVGAQISLVPISQRNITGIDFAREWKECFGDLVGVESISFDATIASPSGKLLVIELTHPDPNLLENIALDMANYLRNYKGISEVDDGVSKGKPQYTFKITDAARSMGLTNGELARQVRSAFYGSEALRQQRGRHEVKALVRLPKTDRQSLDAIENYIIFSPSGKEIPFMEAVEMEKGYSYKDIRRANGRRVLEVTADVDERLANTNKIIENVKEEVIPLLQQKYPGVLHTFQGQSKEQTESLKAMGLGFVAVVLFMYGILATLFNSYVQPLVIMLSIPFGFIGAVIGHIFLGYELSIMSLFGLLALSGVIVNDSLVLIVTVNKFSQDKSMSPFDCVLQATISRFRPIILTSLTTFLGLSPLIFDPSREARFLIPMAISLGVGILFGTFTLFMVTPSVLLIIEDIKKLIFGKEE